MLRLNGHFSPESAYVVDDYPYGFRLRCKIRYWLENRSNYGTRFCSQTTNPKKPGEVWNNEKCSTYSTGIALMFLGDDGHVTWDTCSFYNKESTQKFFDKYQDILTDEEKTILTRLLNKM